MNKINIAREILASQGPGSQTLPDESSLGSLPEGFRPSRRKEPSKLPPDKTLPSAAAPVSLNQRLKEMGISLDPKERAAMIARVLASYSKIPSAGKPAANPDGAQALLAEQKKTTGLPEPGAKADGSPRNFAAGASQMHKMQSSKLPAKPETGQTSVLSAPLVPRPKLKPEAMPVMPVVAPKELNAKIIGWLSKVNDTNSNPVSDPQKLAVMAEQLWGNWCDMDHARRRTLLSTQPKLKANGTKLSFGPAIALVKTVSDQLQILGYEQIINLAGDLMLAIGDDLLALSQKGPNSKI